MDQKTWLWKKRSAHKSIESNTEAENEAERLLYDKELALERTVKSLHEKIASLLRECNAKDSLIAEQSKTVQEAVADRDKVVAEMALKNQELDAAVQQKLEANERLVHVNSALKDYRQQLICLKEEQDQQVVEAVDEQKRANIILEEKFIEASKKLANLTVENGQLANALLMKEELIEEVSVQMSQATIEFNDLIMRLDSADKENDILKFEYRVLERELEIQTQCADVANRQHQESVKRAVKLDSECKKLRLLVKKQITGSNDKRMVFLINQLCEVEEENKILKENLQKRDDEIRLLQAERDKIKCDETHGNGVSPRVVIGDSDMSLMDDFVEMEKLAIVCADATNIDPVGKELVPVEKGDVISPSSDNCDWLQSVVKAILDETHVSKRNIDEVLKEIKIALQCPNDLDTDKSIMSSKTEIEDQLENQKMINEELDHKLSVAQVQINEANQKVLALKVELEDKSQCCEELEATCLDLQLQLASVSDKESGQANTEQELKMVQSGWEITEASAKLAQCQETIINIGRQLKALTPPPSESAELTSDKKSSQHSSLRDVMVAEDGCDVEDLLTSPKTKEIITATETKVLPLVVRVGSCRSRVGPGALTVVPNKKRGKGVELLRKLFFRKKRGSSRNKVLTIGA